MPSKVRSRNRFTHIKIRAVPLVRMPRSVFLDKILVAVQYGVVPEDIELTTMQWDHSAPGGRRYVSGQRLDANDQEELSKAYAVLKKAGTTIRFERPR